MKPYSQFLDELRALKEEYIWEILPGGKIRGTKHGSSMFQACPVAATEGVSSNHEAIMLAADIEDGMEITIAADYPADTLPTWRLTHNVARLEEIRNDLVGILLTGEIK